MRFGIQIQGEYLDLSPGTVLELEEENPFLQLGQTLKGQYSLPFSVLANEKNMRLLGYPNLLTSRKSTAGIDAVLMVEGLRHSRGLVKVESGNGNINRPRNGTISLYYLFGVSDFYKVIENVTLQQVDYGPDYVLHNYGKNDLTPGGFHHFMTDVLNNGTPDTRQFALFPVENTSDAIDDDDKSPELMNGIKWDEFNVNINYLWYFRTNPFPYLKFVIEKAFNHFGWKVYSDYFNDMDFKRVCIIYNQTILITGTGENVIWNLRNHVPNIKISSFLLSLQNRFGWWYDFDYTKKVCTIRFKQDIFLNRTRKSVDHIAGAAYSFRVNAQPKTYSLRQAGGEIKPSLPDTLFKGVLNNFKNLPTPTTGMIGWVYFLQGENAFYICLENQEGDPEWTKSYSNTTDYVVPDSTDDIQTGCLVPDVSIWDYLGGLPIEMHVPQVTLDNSLGETDSFYICYHIGKANSAGGGVMSFPYPFGTPTCHNTDGDLVANTALVYAYKGSDGIERGLYETFWKRYLEKIVLQEEVTIPIKMTVEDMFNMRYTDSLIIKNVEYFIKNPRFTIPLGEYTNMELLRI